jgi:hypothetical protein
VNDGTEDKLPFIKSNKNMKKAVLAENTQDYKVKTEGQD